MPRLAEDFFPGEMGDFNGIFQIYADLVGFKWDFPSDLVGFSMCLRVQRCLAILQRYNGFFFLFCTPIWIQSVLKWDVDGKLTMKKMDLMGFKLHINGRRTQDGVPNYLQLA